MIDSYLIDASNVNAVDALRHLTSTSGGEVWEQSGMLFAASPHSYSGAYHNAAARTNNQVDPTQFIRRAYEFFGDRERDFVLWTTIGLDDDLESAARAKMMPVRPPADGVPCMALETPLPTHDLPPRVELETVRTFEQVATFADVVGQAYAHRDQSPGGSNARSAGQPPEASSAMFGRPETLLSPGCHAVIARLDGVPASCAMYYGTGPVIGLYWVSTVSWARRQGLADLVTRAVINTGFARGASAVVLQASPMGAPMYEHMNFRTVALQRRYFGLAAQRDRDGVDGRVRPASSGGTS
jgi:hypothetical protein